jgi:hypothetical protein
MKLDGGACLVARPTALETTPASGWRGDLSPAAGLGEALGRPFGKKSALKGLTVESISGCAPNSLTAQPPSSLTPLCWCQPEKPYEADILGDADAARL